MRGASLILLQFSCRVLCHNIKSTQRRPTCVQYAITGLRFAPPCPVSCGRSCRRDTIRWFRCTLFLSRFQLKLVLQQHTAIKGVHWKRQNRTELKRQFSCVVRTVQREWTGSSVHFISRSVQSEFSSVQFSLFRSLRTRLSMRQWMCHATSARWVCAVMTPDVFELSLEYVFQVLEVGNELWVVVTARLQSRHLPVDLPLNHQSHVCLE